MRIQLSAGVSSGNVQLGEVADSCDLDVVGGLDEVHSLYSAIRDKTCSVAALYNEGRVNRI